MASKKKRQTFEKLKREQAVREKRALKQEKKAAARLAKAAGLAPPDPDAFEGAETEDSSAEPEEAPADEPARTL